MGATAPSQLCDKHNVSEQGIRRHARRTRSEWESEEHDSSVVAFPPGERHVAGFGGVQWRGTAGHSSGDHRNEYAGRIHPTRRAISNRHPCTHRVDGHHAESGPSTGRGPPAPATTPPHVAGWPPYPGEAKLGDHGDHVRTWQRILIQAGAISDIPENHDGYYGPAMYQVVLRIQQSWGWNDADGVAGPRTYEMITSGAPVPPPQPPQPAPPGEPAGACHSSYDPCVPIASDVDCRGGKGDGPLCTGMVRVIGPDEYDLDDNGDGIGCEQS
jgi:Putative peptidoglycan binding domain